MNWSGVEWSEVERSERDWSGDVFSVLEWSQVEWSGEERVAS